MLNLAFNPRLTDEQRRAALFKGTIILSAANPASLALVALAKQMVTDAFDGADPEHVQETMPVDKFVEIVGPLKSRFTNAGETKDLVVALLDSLGCPLDKTFFDVPRLRVVPHSNYLTAGVSYAYKAHRDIWYSSPASQINWWIPVWDVDADRSMGFYPDYFDRALKNSSADFDYGEWVTVGRTAATQQGAVDTRKHPLPMEDIQAEEFAFGAASGDILAFSASQLHATRNNTSGKARFSLDFRTVHIDDLRTNNGGPTVDSRATGSTLSDFIGARDFTALPAEVMA